MKCDRCNMIFERDVHTLGREGKTRVLCKACLRETALLKGDAQALNKLLNADMRHELWTEGADAFLLRTSALDEEDGSVDAPRRDDGKGDSPSPGSRSNRAPDGPRRT